ncbi:MAG TPA: hypothetical protein VF458_00455 [Ktedonobacteraceae bacterium]
MEGNQPACSNLQSITDRIQKIRHCIQQETLLEHPVASNLALPIRHRAAWQTNAREKTAQMNSSQRPTRWQDFADWNNYPDFRKLF